MYTNGESIGIAKQDKKFERIWRPEKRDHEHTSDKGKRFIQCKCPKCTAHHNSYMLWIGRGVPRKYCDSCRALISRYDDAAMFEASINAPPSHSKTHNRRPESE